MKIKLLVAAAISALSIGGAQAETAITPAAVEPAFFSIHFGFVAPPLVVAPRCVYSRRGRLLYCNY